MKSSVPLFLVSLGLFAFGAASRPQSGGLSRRISFGRDVMPILGQRCFKCHGADAATVAGGLRLDSQSGAVKVIVPGHPSKSRLLDRVSADAETRMPPSDSGVNPLTPSEIETLRLWIAQGARFEKHWSFVPPQMPTLPAVRDTKWVRNNIDRFVLAKLEESGLGPEPEADRDTLAQRAAETLTGLPPTLADLQAFRADAKSGAYERYVDRLLAKSSYGEHAARYWLDAVRYADTHGLQLDNERGIYPYRDWVVRALNQDLPYNKFVEWQVAGDLLPSPTTEQLIATGYVRANLTSAEGGAIDEEFLARNTFDRVDTTSTVMLGLTVQCAKCHDHKYDPIKQRDYYGLYAYFNSTTDKPLDGNERLPAPVVRAATPEQEAEFKRLDETLDLVRRTESVDKIRAYFTANSQALPTTRDWQISPVYSRTSFDEAFDSVEPPENGAANWKPVKLAIGTDLTSIVRKDSASVYIRGTVTFAEAKRFEFGVSSDDGVKVWLNGTLIHSHKIGRGIDMGIDPIWADFRAGDNELLIKVVNSIGPDGVNLRLFSAEQGRIQSAISDYDKSPNDPKAQLELQKVYFELGPTTNTAIRYRKTLKERAELEKQIPMSLIAQEMATPRATYILKRGQYDQKGEAVSRHIPGALGANADGFRKDRLGFAQWLTSPQNPLVARVFVNRVWQQHFGTGLVKTAEDFGTQGEWPMNQLLLDYLAVSFRQSGWSIKQLNRLIVTSAAFRQRSRISALKLAKDPENRLISRGPRFRLDAEVIRDKALMAGGLLVEQLGGRGFKTYQPDGIWEGASDPASQTHIYVRDRDQSIYRRSMYLFWKRTAPPPSMLSFDAPLRDTCVVRRSTTNTPLQALTTENEPTFLEAARTMAARLLRKPGTDRERLALAYNLALARPAKSQEVAILEQALNEYRKSYRGQPEAAKRVLAVGDSPQAKGIDPIEQAAWMIVCSTLMNTDEFLTVH